MSYSNRFSGAITITPPLTWAQIQGAPKTSDAELRVIEERTDTETGWTAVMVADAIVGPDEPCSGYDVEKDIAALVNYVLNHCGKRTLAGHIQVGWDPGFNEPPSRYVVRDGRVVEVKAQYAWPEDAA
jgi:hypothetical protein